MLQREPRAGPSCNLVQRESESFRESIAGDMKATGAHAADSRETGIPLLPIELSVVAGFCGLKLLLHLFTSVRNYGYFRDELYFLDLARHLDWGYVDAAPLIGVYAKVALWLGGSLAALRIIPALAGTVLMGISIFIARELGGGRFAQLLTAILVLLAPGLLAEDNL